MRAVVCGAILFLFTAQTSAAQEELSKFTPREEQPEHYPEAPGREETFYACTACHGFKIVAQQGMSRRQWDETINLMIEKHNMPQPDHQARKLILDYLEATFAPRAGNQRGWQNPFVKN
jgi:hypothetical protein